MALPRLFTFVSGKIKAVVLAIQTSVGAADADKLIATGADGKLDLSFLPTGIGAATTVVVASEALSAGNHVNIYPDSGVSKARKADAATLKRADGFVKTAVAQGANATIYPLGEVNSQLSSLTPGAEYFLSTTTPGGVSTSPPASTDVGMLYQRIGKAVSATELQTVADLAVEIG